MKRNWDLIRTILLKIEADWPSQGVRELESIYFPDQDFSEIDWHFRLLNDGGFLLTANNNYSFVHGISWRGFEFLDTIRDDEIWIKTKKTAIDLQNFSVETIKDIAKAYFKKKFKDTIGLEMN
jgi:hypothetical protein